MANVGGLDRRKVTSICLGAAGCIGFVLPGVERINVNHFLLLLLLFAITIPFMYRFRNGTDLLDPIALTTLTYFILFFVRPLYDVWTGSLVWVYLDVSDAYTSALLSALIAVIFFHFGYASSLGNSIARTFPSNPEKTYDSTLILMAMVMTGVSFLMLFIKAVLAGGFNTLFQSRLEKTSEGINIPFISESFLIATPAFLMLWTVSGENQRIARLLSTFPLIAVLIGAVPGGDRRYMLPLVAGIYVLFHLKRSLKPRVTFAVIAGLLLMFGLLAPIETSRTGAVSFQKSIIKSIGDAPKTVQSLLESQSTSMVSVLALEIQVVGTGKDIGYRFGQSTLVETILQPLPRQIWEEKPETIRTILIEKYWGFEDGRCILMCPTFSSLGTFYSDFGFIGIAFGSLLLGGLVRSSWEYLRMNQSSRIAQVAYSSGYTMPLFIWWSNLGSAVVIFGVYVFPVLLIGWISKVRPATTVASLPSVNRIKSVTKH